jgi:hypothetical protein
VPAAKTHGSHTNKKARPKFVLVLEPLPHVDPIRSLRASLKGLLRRSGMRCVDLHEAHGEKDTPIPSLKEAS